MTKSNQSQNSNNPTQPGRAERSRTEQKKNPTQEEFWSGLRKSGFTEADFKAAMASLPRLVPAGTSTTEKESKPNSETLVSSEPAREAIPVIPGMPTGDEIAEIASDACPPKRKNYFWIKTTAAGVFTLLIISILGGFYYNSYENIEDQDWKKFLGESCRPTIRGNLKAVLFDELDLWIHIKISMDSWQNSVRHVEDLCNDRYSTSSQEMNRLQCLAPLEAHRDHISRCRPVVLLACRQAGGCGN